MTSQPEIIMTIRDRYTTIYECTASGCKWSRLALGVVISAEREALEHRMTHDEQTR